MGFFPVGSCERGVDWCCIFSQFGESKVQQFRTGLREHDVARLQIAVRHAFAMSLVQSIGNLDGVLQHLI